MTVARGLVAPAVRGVLAGGAGTVVMSCTEWLHVQAHRRWWPQKSWRWPFEALVASVVEHAIYAAVAVSVGDRLRGGS